MIQVLAEWALSDDEATRFDALALIEDFKLAAALPALRKLAVRLGSGKNRAYTSNSRRWTATSTAFAADFQRPARQPAAVGYAMISAPASQRDGSLRAIETHAAHPLATVSLQGSNGPPALPISR
jgi:hypothetical protein